MIAQGVIGIENLREFLSKIPDGCVLINSDYVVDLDVLKFAVQKALKSWKEGRNVAKTLSMEILLYVAATRQINKALKIGLKEGINRVIVVDVSGCIEKLKKLGFREEEVLKVDEEKIKRVADFYEIGEEELNLVGRDKLPLLIRERIALFDITK